MNDKAWVLGMLDRVVGDRSVYTELEAERLRSIVIRLLENGSDATTPLAETGSPRSKMEFDVSVALKTLKEIASGSGYTGLDAHQMARVEAAKTLLLFHHKLDA